MVIGAVAILEALVLQRVLDDLVYVGCGALGHCCCRCRRRCQMLVASHAHAHSATASGVDAVERKVVPHYGIRAGVVLVELGRRMMAGRIGELPEEVGMRCCCRCRRCCCR